MSEVQHAPECRFMAISQWLEELGPVPGRIPESIQEEADRGDRGWICVGKGCPAWAAAYGTNWNR